MWLEVPGFMIHRSWVCTSVRPANILGRNGTMPPPKKKYTHRYIHMYIYYSTYENSFIDVTDLHMSAQIEKWCLEHLNLLCTNREVPTYFSDAVAFHLTAGVPSILYPFHFICGRSSSSICPSANSSFLAAPTDEVSFDRFHRSMRTLSCDVGRPLS